MVIDNDFYMQLAIDEAWKYQLLTYPNPAVGAVVLKNGEILSISAHKQAGSPHAEVLALKEAFLKKNPTSPLKVLNSSYEIHNFLINNHNDFFKDCEIYITLEPCNHFGSTPACSDLLVSVGIKRVFIGYREINKQASGGIEKLKQNGIEVVIGIKEKEAKDLLYPFIKWQLAKNFTIFKLALRLNGSISGGYISSSESLDYVHAIRDKIDLLVIGGNTVRIDRPTLDSRRIGGKAPNIQIISRQVSFDKNIPLFKVPNREVKISTKLSDIKEHNFVLVEGGYVLLKTLANFVDMFMLIVSPEMLTPFKIYKIDIEFEVIAITKKGIDTIYWLKLRK